ncbi:MAG: pyridoxamine 5'-phosphate oxidase family protein [Clostridiales bacterium]|nr:pyridoxamine 5'-phosphate oxidase family protein [Clostridiales bacterium]
MNPEMHEVMTERFGKDSLIALATVEGDMPHVRAVNSYYMDGAFYCVTDARSNKMKQIEMNPKVAICGEWFTGHGTGENLGHVLREENRAIMQILRPAFAAWYLNGHVDESDPNTILLRITLTQGALMKHGRRFSFPD